MSDNPIIITTSDPLFIKREYWLRERLDEALIQPFISFSEAISTYDIGLYFIYDDKELLYIGMTERPGQNRIKEISSNFRKHTLNRKLMAEHFRSLDYKMQVLSVKNFQRDWIHSELITVEQLRSAQLTVNRKIREKFRFKFYEFRYFDLGVLEHYAIAILRPLYND